MLLLNIYLKSAFILHSCFVSSCISGPDREFRLIQPGILLSCGSLCLMEIFMTRSTRKQTQLLPSLSLQLEGWFIFGPWIFYWISYKISLKLKGVIQAVNRNLTFVSCFLIINHTMVDCCLFTVYRLTSLQILLWNATPN